ncbi:MAG: CHAT domain-containing protein [Anaerolineae bacterium]|nr:CHAT domain-containing protein [Anaerolineae bacterium]
MTDYADLEIGVHRRDANSYSIELRYSQPDSDADVRLVRDGPSQVRFDMDRLRSQTVDVAAYGRQLSESLLANPDVKLAFAQARSNAQSLDAPLRLRLFIGPSAPELHSLRWETLGDPDDGSPLLTGEHILFSRYLSSLDWHPVHLRPKSELRALVVIANPTNLDDYGLAPVDVEGELERVKSGLDGIPSTALASGGNATLNTIVAHLREGYDVLYLICHGALIKGAPKIWLEDEAGNVAVVAGSELVTRLRELRRRPRLVILASCESAGTGSDTRSTDEGALAALGPRLAEAGIPAVLAMQGNITMRTVTEFMPVFFSELRKDGQIDRAMAVARGGVRERADWWAPALFLRLKSGRLWYTPGFADDPQGLEKWPALLRHIHRGHCTPILGPGLAESLLGTRQEIARRWAETYHFPMSPHDQDDLPQVAQYLAVHLDQMFLRDEWEEHLRQQILRHPGDDLPDDWHDTSLGDLITAAGVRQREQNVAEPHKVLAKLPLPIYITTDPSDLLKDALIAAGKEPLVALCPWNEDVAQLTSVFDDDPDYRPDVQHPLVYHLFGHIQEPDSLVLTEDNYFDYLIGVTRDKNLIPGVVRRTLVDTALLFLGFQMDDWNFRVLFRSLMSQEGRRRRGRYAHVAAQIDPEGGRTLEPERARRYLESYFQDADISIFWGSVEDFVQELLSRWSK